MARQGTKRNHFAFGFPMVGLFLAVLFLVSPGWSICAYGSGYVNSPGSACSDGTVRDPCQSQYIDCVKATGSNFGKLVSCEFTGKEMVNGRCHFNNSYLCCTSDCEIDSVTCVSPNTWIPGTNGECGYCEMPPDDDDVCQAAKQSCLNLRGRFSGHALKSGDGYCCSGTCDLCNSLSIDKLFNVKRQVCCNRLEAPPKKTRMCSTPLQSGCGITTSSIVNDDNEWTCTDPNQDAEAQSWFNEVCSPNYSSGGGDGDESSSSGDTPNTSTSDTPNTSTSDTPNTSTSDTPNTSTSEEESSSSDEDPNTSTSHPHSSSSDLDSLSSSSFSSSSVEELCPECDLLDSVLTLFDSMQTQAEEIFLCLTNPGLCPALDGPDSMRVRDSVVAGLLSDIRQDLQDLANTLGVSTDSVVAEILRGIQSDLQNANDTTHKWLKIIADSIGVSTDSLAAHLDSILKHIPDSVLDSIVKYQKYASDNFDSVLYGSGKGFSLVDSLIDSAVKYFQISGHYDSIYHILFADSMGSIHGEITEIPERIAYYLGYGDTASTDLHGDLNGIKDAINGLGDGLGELGDGIGSGVAGALDSAIGSGEGADVSGVDYDWLERGDLQADTMLRASGFAGIDFEADSLLRDSLAGAGYVCNDSSCCMGSECIEWDSDQSIQDSMARFVTHMGESLRVKNENYLADSVPALFQEVKDSLMVWNPVGIFDSTVMRTLGMTVPNSNTCPENCSKFEVDIPFPFGSQHFTIDYGLCLGRSVFADGNVLSFLRFIVRVIVAFTCISAVMWNAARVKR